MAEYNVADFLPENVGNPVQEVKVKFKRFKAPFVIKSLTGADITRLRSEATKREFNKKTHLMEESLNTEKLTASAMSESIVAPDLHDKKLLEAYGVFDGNVNALLEKMLTAGEYNALATKVNEVSGISADSSELIEQAKN